MAEINFGLLDTQLPGRIATIPLQAQEAGQANALRTMQMMQGMSQNRLSDLNYNEQMRGIEEQKQLRNVLSGIDVTTREGRIDAIRKAAGINPKTGFELQKMFQEDEKRSADLLKTRAETDKIGFERAIKNREQFAGELRQLALNPTDDNVRAVFSKGISFGVPMQDIAADQARILALPLDQRARTLAAYGAHAADVMKQVTPEFRGMGGNIYNVSPGAVDSTTGMPRNVGALTAAPSTDAAMISAGAAVERNRIAARRLNEELAVGAPSQQSIDFMAETYLQTGVMPPLGMGRQAANLRQQVVARAAELGTAAPATGAAAPTVGEAVSNVTVNKQTRAGQASAFRDFSSGVSARRVTANNTAINHLATMEKLASDLGNSDIGIVNRASNMFAKETGSTAPANFDAAKQLVAAEVIKAVVNNGGGVTERQEAQENFAKARSPEQLRGVINTYKELLAGQLQSLGQQYEVNTGRKDFSNRLNPETQKVYRSMSGSGTPQAPAAVAPQGRPSLANIFNPQR